MLFMFIVYSRLFTTFISHQFWTHAGEGEMKKKKNTSITISDVCVKMNLNKYQNERKKEIHALHSNKMILNVRDEMRKHTHISSIKTSPWAPLGLFNKSNRPVRLCVVFLSSSSLFLQIKHSFSASYNNNLSHKQFSNSLFGWLVGFIVMFLF